MKRRIVAGLFVVALAAASCGGNEPAPGSRSDDEPAGFNDSYEDAEAYPQFISSEVVVGKNRFLVGLLDDNDAPIGSRDISVTIAFYDLQGGGSKPVERSEMEFVPIERSRGVYVTYPTFGHAGTWGAEVTIEGPSLDEDLKGNFEVRESGTTPALGAQAPSSDTPTAADVDDLSAISTDPHPDPRFYQKSVAEALADGDPFVLAFATPKFCQTASCGPALDIVEAVSKGYRDVTFIHVEPYENLDDIGNVVPAVEEWGLPSEPYIFVVDDKGKVAAKFEGVVGEAELRRAVDAL